MRCIIAGSRSIWNYDEVEDAIESSGWPLHIHEVVSGASLHDVEQYRKRLRKANVDILGATWADTNQIPVKYFPADWDTYGKAAGPIRNEQMAEYADALILVWTGHSSGSADMLRRAKAHGLKIYEHIVTLVGIQRG